MPGQEQQMKLKNLRGIDQLTVRFYEADVKGNTELSPNNEKDYKKLKPLLKELPQYQVVCRYQGKKAYEVYEDSLQMPTLPVGVYMIEVESKPATAVSRRLYFVSNVRTMAEALPDNHLRYVVVDAQEGQPIAGASLELTGYVNGSRQKMATLTTDARGEAIYHYAKNTGRPYIHPDAKYESRYLDCPNEPLYAFGHGLSYTTFEYSDIVIGDARSESGMTIKADGTLTVRTTVTNTGSVEGTETVQLYIRDLVGSVTRPVRQLKGFERVTLKPGESKEVTFTIDKEMLSFYRQDMTWGPEPGDFKVFIGGASDNTKEASFRYEI
jgi:hypothetical protein